MVATPASWLPGHGPITDCLPAAASVTGFLALEHGLRGDLQDGIHFDSYVDTRTSAPVFSFYGREPGFPRELLSTVDVLVFHVQDVSHRAYTYKWALADMLATAAEAGVEVLVLDRPTPLSHLGFGGPVWRQYFPLPLPVVIPATLGELARWLVRKQALDVSLTVLPAQGWKRSHIWADTALPWIPPSPNVPSVDSAYCYACTGILQRTNVSEGRGTCKPFEYFGAPFLDSARLAAALNAHGLPGVLFREVFFTPAFNKYAGELCAGMHLMITDHTGVDPVTTTLRVLQELARLHGDAFQAEPGLSEWLDGGEWDAARLARLDVSDVVREARQQSAEFARDIAPDLLYRG